MTYAEHRAAIAREDNEPCPRCGGDKLRPDFTGSGYCHAPKPPTRRTPMAETIVDRHGADGKRMASDYVINHAVDPRG